MEFERTAIHTREEVSSQPGNQNRQRPKTASKEHNHKNLAVVETSLQQAAIAPAKLFEGLLKALLHSYERVATGTGTLPFISAQKILGHGGNDRPRKQIRGQHREYHGFGERNKEISRYAGQQEHRGKHYADRKCGYEGRSCNLGRAVQDN